jgi:hypothetical protein
VVEHMSKNEILDSISGIEISKSCKLLMMFKSSVSLIRRKSAPLSSFFLDTLEQACLNDQKARCGCAHL